MVSLKRNRPDKPHKLNRRDRPDKPNRPDETERLDKPRILRKLLPLDNRLLLETDAFKGGVDPKKTKTYVDYKTRCNRGGGALFFFRLKISKFSTA